MFFEVLIAGLRLLKSLAAEQDTDLKPDLDDVLGMWILDLLRVL